MVAILVSTLGSAGTDSSCSLGLHPTASAGNVNIYISSMFLSLACRIASAAGLFFARGAGFKFISADTTQPTSARPI